MRLIDAYALDDMLDKIEGLRAHATSTDGIMVARRKLTLAPTIDSEPVVRCNMCKYYEAEVGFCHYYDRGMHWDDFCSRCAKMDLEVQDGS